MSSQARAKPHIIVIGAGVVGASVGWNLTLQNADVTIVASDIGGTATPNSFSWLNASWRNPKSYYDFRRRSMAAWKRLAEEWCGSLEWDMPPEELAEYERKQGAWGYDIRRAERSEIHEREPWLSSDVLPEWGLRIGEEGFVEAADAASLMLVPATVTVLGVVLKTGEKLSADHVVLAAGVGSTQLCASVDITLPVTGEAGLLCTRSRSRNTAKGRILAGAGFAGGDPGENPQKTAEELFARVRGMFSLEASDADVLQLDCFTIGQRPMPQDRLPILGASGLEGLSLAVMHSGVTLAAIVGEVLTDDIVNGRKDPALGDYALDRFALASL
ncbi:fructosyl peptide oxidase [Mycena olivaceomarginata]|nr:fructosyl peptide oxidase [Mycena olivaceomarginata]